MKRLFATMAIIMLLALAPVLHGCSDEAVPADAPDGHTVMKDGVPHASGLNDPETNCATCHGATLEGGANGEPSCFSCHGREW